MPHSEPTWLELVQGWQLGIYRDPIWCGLVAGLALGYLGVFVVLRRMVFITAAVSQAAGMGVALAFFAQIHFDLAVPAVAGAIAMALLFTFLFSLPADRLPISREAALGVAYIVAWALSVMLGDRISQEAHDIASILFGTAVLVRSEDLYAVIGAASIALLFHGVAHRGVAFALFDPEGARVQRLPTRLLDLGSWLCIALVVSVATRALGVLPVFAFAIVPAIAGLLLFDRLGWVLAAAAAIGALAGAGGYVAAFFLNLPVGACQAAVASGTLVVVWLARIAIGRP
jgi:zinc transport system permease protein